MFWPPFILYVGFRFQLVDFYGVFRFLVSFAKYFRNAITHTNRHTCTIVYNFFLPLSTHSPTRIPCVVRFFVYHSIYIYIHIYCQCAHICIITLSKNIYCTASSNFHRSRAHIHTFVLQTIKKYTHTHTLDKIQLSIFFYTQLKLHLPALKLYEIEGGREKTAHNRNRQCET